MSENVAFTHPKVLRKIRIHVQATTSTEEQSLL